MPAGGTTPPSDHQLTTARTVIRAYQTTDAAALYQTGQ